MQLWTSKNYHKNDKIYRGAFAYYRNDNQYAEETFDVYRDKKEYTLHYISEAVIRVATGEILNLHIEYIVNKEYVPTYVMIEKLMGKSQTNELFEFNNKRNVIAYSYDNHKDVKTTIDISTAPKYHITTPTTASSILFLRSKKFDSSGRNTYNILRSDNMWDYKEPPRFSNILLERVSLTNEKINIDGQSVNSVPYRLYDESTDFKKVKEPPHIKVYLSPHGSIPYMLKTDDGTRIQIKYLNDLSDKE